MCLEIKSYSFKKIAIRNIVVYKRLVVNNNITINEINDGDSFSGVISGIKCTGKIHKASNGVLFFCTNDERLNGLNSTEKHSYNYSWKLDYHVTSIIVNDVEMIKLIITSNGYCTPYQSTSVSIGKTYTSELIRYGNDIENGLHSFHKLAAAINDGYGIYVKCIIPIGSRYYSGKFGANKSYASNALKYIEIIEDKKLKV